MGTAPWAPPLPPGPPRGSQWVQPPQGAGLRGCAPCCPLPLPLLCSEHHLLQVTVTTVCPPTPPPPPPRHHLFNFVFSFQSRVRACLLPHEYTHACCPSSPLRLIVSIFFPYPRVTLVTPMLTHHPLKECFQSSPTEGAFLEPPEHPQLTHHSKRLFSIPEVAEEGEHLELLHRQGLGYSARARARACSGDEAPQASWLPAKARGPGGGPPAKDVVLEDRGCRLGRVASRSPDSGLDCGSEEEELRFSFRSTAKCSPGPGHCPCRSLRPLLARRRTLTRQSSIEEDFGEQVDPNDVIRSDDTHLSPERSTPRKYGWEEPLGHHGSRDIWKKSIKMPDSRATAPEAPPWVAEGPVVCEVNFLLTSACQTNPCSFFYLIYFCWCPSLGSRSAGLSVISMHFDLSPIASQSLPMLTTPLLCFRILTPSSPPESATIMAASIKGQLNLNFN